MEQPSALKSFVSSAMVEKLAVGMEPISCVYPNCRSSAPVELFNVHLARCRRNWLGPQAATCSYNSAHVVPAPEQRYHELTCPDRWLNDELSECKEKLQEVSKSASRSGNGATKKQGCETSGVSTNRGHFYRGGSYSKWRNVGPRLQNRHAKQYESDPDWYEEALTAGRGQRSMKWQRSSVTGYRGGHRPSRGLAFVGYRTREDKLPSIPVSSNDDLPAPRMNGFSPWASSKPRPTLINTVRWSCSTRGRWTTSAYGLGGRQNGFK